MRPLLLELIPFYNWHVTRHSVYRAHTNHCAYIAAYTHLFGSCLGSTPLLSMHFFVLQHHAKEFKDTFPLAAGTVLRSSYMDDSMDSVANEDQGIELHRQLSHLLRQARRHARKWLSNSPRVLRDIPLQDPKAEVDLDADYLRSTKTLGVWWLSDQDVFTLKENAPSSNVKYTKRNFLKQIATLIDPIGLLAPFNIRAKMLLQQMWMA